MALPEIVVGIVLVTALAALGVALSQTHGIPVAILTCIGLVQVLRMASAAFWSLIPASIQRNDAREKHLPKGGTSEDTVDAPSERASNQPDNG